MKFQLPYHSLWPYDKIRPTKSTGGKRHFFKWSDFCLLPLSARSLFCFFLYPFPGIFFFFPPPHNSRKIFCSLSGQQEAKLKTNNVWISTARQSECWLRSEKQKERKEWGKDPKERKGPLRDLEGRGSGGARLPRLMWEVWAKPAGMLSGTSH